MKSLVAALTLTCLATTAPITAADDSEAHFSIGIYAAEAEVEAAWSCSWVVEGLEAAMSEALEYPVSLDLVIEESHEAGVTDMTEGNVQFGRFPNTHSNWLLNPTVTDEVAEAWVSALRAVDPENIQGYRDAQSPTDCGNDKFALLGG